MANLNKKAKFKNRNGPKPKIHNNKRKDYAICVKPVLFLLSFLSFFGVFFAKHYRDRNDKEKEPANQASKP